MINLIRSKGRLWQRRSKNLKSGEINCVRCGDWKRVSKFTDRHFKEEYFCRTCKKELTKAQKKTTATKVSGKNPKKLKPYFPKDCLHRPFFWCKTPSKCIGCYYNPEKKIALMRRFEDDEKKTAKVNWFYGRGKRNVKKLLKFLDDIKHGRGLHRGSTRLYFRYARKSEND